MTKFVEVEVDPFKEATLPPAAKAQLLKNIELCRDAVVFFTACGSASGYGGHTGGAYDTMPEAMLLREAAAEVEPSLVPSYSCFTSCAGITSARITSLHPNMAANQAPSHPHHGSWEDRPSSTRLPLQTTTMTMLTVEAEELQR